MSTFGRAARKMVLCAHSNRLGQSREQLLADAEGALGAKSEVLPFMRDGIAYHHAGLSREEGEAVAGAYKRASFAFCAAQARWRQV